CRFAALFVPRLSMSSPRCLLVRDRNDAPHPPAPAPAALAPAPAALAPAPAALAPAPAAPRPVAQRHETRVPARLNAVDSGFHGVRAAPDPRSSMYHGTLLHHGAHRVTAGPNT